jgi:hypothetical protein
MQQPPIPRIVEGTLVESTLLVPAPPPPSILQGEEGGQHPLRALRRWVGQGLLTVLVALCTVLALTPTQPRIMRLVVTLVPAAGVTATTGTDQGTAACCSDLDPTGDSADDRQGSPACRTGTRTSHLLQSSSHRTDHPGRDAA